MIKENISAMSDEHTGWLSALEFYKGELSFIKNRLTEIAGKNTDKEVGAQVEHFENQVKVQTQNVDHLRHDIVENLAKAVAQLKESNAGYIDTELVKEHTRQKERFFTEERVVNEFRQEFNRFATQWM